VQQRASDNFSELTGYNHTAEGIGSFSVDIVAVKAVAGYLTLVLAGWFFMLCCSATVGSPV